VNRCADTLLTLVTFMCVRACESSCCQLRLRAPRLPLPEAKQTLGARGLLVVIEGISWQVARVEAAEPTAGPLEPRAAKSAYAVKVAASFCTDYLVSVRPRHSARLPFLSPPI
jgi:hypothetical protein